MALIIAGERSGVGKTTIALALLATLIRRGVTVQSFKVGPDYIDPMFHTYVTGRACRNLDPFLTSEAYVQQCFNRHAQTASHNLIEGVMGLFDGAIAPPGFGSTAHVARLLNQPIALVLDSSRLSHSIAALVHGYRSFDPQLTMAGVILNRVGSDRHQTLLQSALEPLGIPILGILRREDGITIPDRHLGLIPAGELPQLDALIDQLATLGSRCFDWSQLEPLLTTPTDFGFSISDFGFTRSQEPGTRSQKPEGNPLSSSHPPTLPPSPLRTPHSALRTPHFPPPHSALRTPLRLAIAQDAAFNFYYADNLDLLRSLGAELIPWSPMHDAHLPAKVQGLYFGGGFPEVFAAALAENQPLRQQLHQLITNGLPTYAECGGLMYLCEQIVDFNEVSYPMVGVLPTTTVLEKRLTLGYRRAIAQASTPLVTPGTHLQGHEFHRSTLTTPSPHPLYQFLDHPTAPLEGWHTPHLHASYLHLHWGNTPELPQRFLQHCLLHSESF